MNVGIIGLGYMGVVHLGAFLRSPDAKVKAICSSDQKKLQGDFSSVVGNLSRSNDRMDLTGVDGLTNWSELIARPDVDAVDICLPTDLHPAVVIQALEAGKHVLVEKPMALTEEDCNTMLAAARRSGKVLMIAHVLRFWPEYLRLKSFVKGRSSGPVTLVTFERKCGAPVAKEWIRDESRSGGALLDLLVHDLDQAIQLFGWPDAVGAVSSGGIDTVAANLFYKSGVQVNVNGGWYEESRAFSMSFRAVASKGVLSLGCEGVLTHVSNHGTSIVIETEGTDAFQAEVDYFVDCCRRRKQPEQCPPAESALAVKLANLLRESRLKGGVRLECTV